MFHDNFSFQTIVLLNDFEPVMFGMRQVWYATRLVGVHTTKNPIIMQWVILAIFLTEGKVKNVNI
jgi:hypothetical protein